tara:strand:+ start:588 stop:806 length:219 start_codon:yes stop_codon:yes gene_type:complete
MKKEFTSLTKRHYKKTHEQIDNTVGSPCISVCTFHDNGEYCIGCKRTREELREWWIMTADQKLLALDRIKTL